MTSQVNLLEMTGVSAEYGVIEALHDVTLVVRSGEFVSILGANGAGKSTLLKVISGIHPPKSGDIKFSGRSTAGIPAHNLVRLGMAHVPEGRRIFPKLTVHENLLLGAYTRPDSAEHKASEEYIYDLFPVLVERKKQLGGTLSGGEQQMLAIGRALMSKPQFLLLDEPSMGIAPILTAKIFEALKVLNKGGITIVLVEQNANQALAIAEKAYVLELGRITIDGSAKELAHDSRVKEAYLGA